MPDADGLLRSRGFPGLRWPPFRDGSAPNLRPGDVAGKLLRRMGAWPSTFNFTPCGAGVDTSPNASSQPRLPTY